MAAKLLGEKPSVADGLRVPAPRSLAALSRRPARLRKVERSHIFCPVDRGGTTSTIQRAAAKEKAKAKEVEAKLAERERKEQATGKKTGGRPPQAPDPDEAVAEPKSQRNFTDPESRFMKDGASKSFEQAYNAQAAVDAEAQVIVASSITQETNDQKQLVPLLEKVQEKTGQMPEKSSADSGYFSEAAVSDARVQETDL